MGVFASLAGQIVDILEVVAQGTATSSAVFGGVLARCSTNSATQTALASPAADGPQNPGTVALGTPVKTYTAATTVGIPSSATGDTKFPMVINAFGGLYRENFAPTQQLTILGATAPLSEVLLFNSSSYAGTSTSAACAIMYEPY